MATKSAEETLRKGTTMGRKLWITTSAVVLLWAGVAQAQQIDDAETKAQADQAEVLGDVVVTAERRTSNLQTTAVAATVLSGEDLTNKAVTSLDQLQFAAPSTTIQNFGQGNFFNVRGIGKSEKLSGQTHVDGLPL